MTTASDATAAAIATAVTTMGQAGAKIQSLESANAALAAKLAAAPADDSPQLQTAAGALNAANTTLAGIIAAAS